jgi:hypothetical protein
VVKGSAVSVRKLCALIAAHSVLFPYNKSHGDGAGQEAATTKRRRIIMRKSFSIVCRLAVMVGVFIGCDSANKKEEAAQPSPQNNGANVASNPGEQRQYRAVCLEKEAHGGNQQVLSKWLDEKEKADELGKYHTDFKEKGHRVIIEERVKPEQATP